MSRLKQQIEKMSWLASDRYGVREEVVTLSEVLKKVADCVCIPTKQLEERLGDLQSQYDKLMIPSKEGPVIRKQIDFLKKLLEDSKKKEQP